MWSVESKTLAVGVSSGTGLGIPGLTKSIVTFNFVSLVWIKAVKNLSRCSFLRNTWNWIINSNSDLNLQPSVTILHFQALNKPHTTVINSILSLPLDWTLRRTFHLDTFPCHPTTPISLHSPQSALICNVCRCSAQNVFLQTRRSPAAQ